MLIHNYLFFGGNCEDAFAAYAAILGGEITMTMRYRDNPDGHVPPGMEDAIMHTSLTADGALLMGSDSPPGMHRAAGSFATSLTFDDLAKAERVFRGLAEGGSVGMAWGETFWAKGFGMLTDRFGIPWMVQVAKPM